MLDHNLINKKKTKITLKNLKKQKINGERYHLEIRIHSFGSSEGISLRVYGRLSF